jgi:hypothetical protein
MEIDWNQLGTDLNSIIAESADKTDEKLASQISNLTRMNNEEIIKLFPKPSDVQNLFELMKIVKSADETNKKVNNIVQNSEKFGGVILTLLSKLA